MDKLRVSLAKRLGAETRAWVRTIDALMVLMASLGLAGAIFLYPIKLEIPLLKAAFYGALACTPAVAYLLFRESDLGRLERIAILGLVLCLGLALMIAAVEAARVS